MVVLVTYKNLQEYIEARTAWFLREGLSPEQLRKLYWDGRQSVPEIAKAEKLNPQNLYELMRKYGIERRTRTESNYVTNKDKPKFQLRQDLTSEQERLRIAGLMLYWAEGAKGRHSVDLANADPKVISVFLRFLREVCGVAELRLRVYLFIYEGQDPEPIRQYWSRLTRFLLSNSKNHMSVSSGKTEQDSECYITALSIFDTTIQDCCNKFSLGFKKKHVS